MSNVLVRFLASLIALPVVLFLLFWEQKWGFLVLLYLVCIVSGVELLGMVMPNRFFERFWGVLCITAIFSAIVFGFHDYHLLITIVVSILLSMGLVLFRPNPIQQAASRVAWLITGPLLIGSLLAILGLLFVGERGSGWVLFVLSISWFSDTAAFFAGRSLGKHRLYPTISPKKTVEGSIFGLFAGGLSAVIAHFSFLPILPLSEGILLAVLACGLGQMGDLCESLLKRSVGVKDSGWVIPGHGGILDRIDSVLFVTVPVWVYAEIVIGGQ